MLKHLPMDLEIPWAIDFIDATTALITERPGKDCESLNRGVLQSEPVKNIPESVTRRSGRINGCCS